MELGVHAANGERAGLPQRVKPRRQLDELDRQLRNYMAELHGSSCRATAPTAQRGYTAMTKDRQLTDAEMRARALARWEGEGGALAPSGAADSIDESELRILARLGAAVLGEWGELSLALQRNVLHRARTLGGPGDHARVKEKFGRFLHEHRSEC